MARRRPDELIGENVWEEPPDAAGSLAHHEFERALRDQVAAHFEMFYAPYDRWFEYHVYPSAERLSVFFRDVTTRKEAERKIQLLNGELQSKVRELEASKLSLQEKSEDLEKFHDVVIGGELKMMELEVTAKGLSWSRVSRCGGVRPRWSLMRSTSSISSCVFRNGIAFEARPAFRDFSMAC